ncbi:oligopeptide ABC transporter substrate-binding protein [Oceanobacillus sp. Castelsardo]|uniref:oligopeptide ABC transporter substrate-binding protein n=1 Tax=Oceanobacillus sp. Castelsardo TaxID=1851204 RepID=UPI0008397BFD|nr:oligopeptide ABC transporter substrate-binding protein [Oceanobacillus sp. Castelsardo]
MRKSKWILVIMLIMFVLLVACGNDSNGESEDTIYSIEDFSTDSSTEGEAIDGGTLNYGLVTETPFEGTLNYNFYSGSFDNEIIKWFDESLLSVDKNHNYTQDGAATFKVSEDHHTFTFTIRDNVNWHDGEPVKAEDWAYAIEVIGHPDYDGPRYDSSFRNIAGMEEYHNGDTNSISGLEVVDEKTLKITYIEGTPSLLAGGVWPYALPKHIFEDIPVADMSASDAVRKNPIGFGPFKVESIVPGESVSLTANGDYWQGAPKLDGVTVKVVNPQTIVQALKSGDVDVVDSFPSEQYADVEASLTNVEFLGKVDMSYSYIGFKLGTWDKEAQEVKPDPDAKMADVNLRRAMWYAVDNDAVAKQFYNGLRWNANTLIPPSHPDYHDDSIEAPTFDPEKAKQILDEAGYVDTNNDGMRENPDGEELVINFASMSSGDIAEPLTNYYVQSWEQVGLNVQLLDGRLIEFNSFYDRIGQNGDDDPAVDIYQGAWSVATDVDPSGLYGRQAIFNFSRYASEENDRLLKEGLSEEAFDSEYRQEVYSEWQQLMVDEIPVFPTLFRSILVPINKRVVNYSIGPDFMGFHEIGVTHGEPFKAE